MKTIEFDAAKEAANLAKHGLSLSLAAQFDELAVTAPAKRKDGELRYKITGPVEVGLVTAVVTDRPSATRVISLRWASRAERRAYANQIR